MRGDFPPRRTHGGDGFRIFGQRHRDTEDGDRNVSFGEQTMQPPKSGAGAVFINALHVRVAGMGEWGGADNFGEKGFRFLVAVQQAAFAPLFVIDDALDREARPVGPIRRRRVLTVADEIPKFRRGGHWTGYGASISCRGRCCSQRGRRAGEHGSAPPRHLPESGR